MMKRDKFKVLAERLVLGDKIRLACEKLMDVYAPLKTRLGEIESGRMGEGCPSGDLPDHQDLEAFAEELESVIIPRAWECWETICKVEDEVFELTDASHERQEMRKPRKERKLNVKKNQG